MRTRYSSILLAFVISTGCGTAPAAVEQKKAAKAAVPATSTCPATWKETADWVMALQSEPSNGFGNPQVPMVDASFESDVEADGFGLEVKLVDGALRFEDGSDHPGDFEAWLRRNYVRLRKLRPDETVRNGVDLFVSPGTPWAAVVDTIARARAAGAKEVAFWFRRPHALTRPTSSPRDAAIAQAPSRELADRIVNLQAVLEPCPELARLAPRVASGKLIATLADFSDECRCKIDQDSLRSIFWAVHPADAMTGRVFGVAPDAKDVQIVAAPAGATWAEVAPQVLALPRGARVDFRVR